jgi:hypothetical protein
MTTHELAKGRSVWEIRFKKVGKVSIIYRKLQKPSRNSKKSKSNSFLFGLSINSLIFFTNTSIPLETKSNFIEFQQFQSRKLQNNFQNISDLLTNWSKIKFQKTLITPFTVRLISRSNSQFNHSTSHFHCAAHHQPFFSIKCLSYINYYLLCVVDKTETVCRSLKKKKESRTHRALEMCL